MNIDYRTSMKGVAFLRILEGWSAKYYLDAATPPVGTIGIGFTWRSNAFRTWWVKKKPGMKFGPGATMTRDEADDALAYILDNEYGASVEKFFNKAGREFPQNQFDGAESVVYNLGAGSLDWKWAQALAAGDVGKAATLLETTGVTAGGKKLKGLETRRKEESELLRTGDYTIAGHGPVDPMVDGILQRGERGPEVMALQLALQALGYYGQKIDEVFGYGTEQAVISFQKAKGLKADGWAGPATLDAINDASGVAVLPKPVGQQPQPAPAPAPKPTPAAPAQPAPTGEKKASGNPMGTVIIGALAALAALVVYFITRG